MTEQLQPLDYALIALLLLAITLFAKPVG